MKNLHKALIIATLFAALAAIFGLLHATSSSSSTWRQVLLGMGSFGCFGFLLGGIYAFDPDSELRIKSSSIGRMFFGLIASLFFSAMWHFPGKGMALAALVGVILGYFGMMWAKYVDF